MVCWIGVIVDLGEGVVAVYESIAGRVCEDGPTKMVRVAFHLCRFCVH